MLAVHFRAPSLRSARAQVAASLAARILLSFAAGDVQSGRALRSSARVPRPRLPADVPARRAVPVPPAHLPSIPRAGLARGTAGLQRLQLSTIGVHNG